MPNKVVDYVSIVKSKEYQQRLVGMANSIKNSSKIAPNEATIESRFDCELFAFLRIYLNH